MIAAPKSLNKSLSKAVTTALKLMGKQKSL